MYLLNFDGLFRGKEEGSGLENGMSVMCYGWVIRSRQDVVARGYGSYTHPHVASSNGAEYLALIEGLKACLDLGLAKERLLVLGDAKSVIDQMLGLSGVTSFRVMTLHHKAQGLGRQFHHIGWKWIPRGENKEADRLSRAALLKLPRQKQDTLAMFGTRGGVPGFRLLADLMMC